MHRIIFVTASGAGEAKRIAKAVISHKLAACVNIIKGVKSYFWWEGKIDSSDEVQLIIKTKKGKVPEVIKLVKSLHSYEVPEIISIPIASGFKPYLRWIDESVR